MTNNESWTPAFRFGTVVRATVFGVRNIAVYVPVPGDDVSEEGLVWTIGDESSPEYFVRTKDLSNIQILFEPPEDLPTLTIREVQEVQEAFRLPEHIKEQRREFSALLDTVPLSSHPGELGI